MRVYVLFLALLCNGLNLLAQKNKVFQLSSPDNKLVVTINTGQTITWSVTHNGQTILSPSTASLQLNTGEIMGTSVQVNKSRQETIDEILNAVCYKKSRIENKCRQLTIEIKGDYGIIFRAYNDGAAYRFFTKRKGELIIRNEQ